MRNWHTASRTVHALMSSAAVLCLAHTANAEELIDFSIPPQPLANALLSFSGQSKAQVVTASASIADLNTKGVSERLTPRAALARLIEGSDLEIRSSGEHSFSLLARSDEAKAGKPALVKVKAASEETGPPVADAAPAATESDKKKENRQREVDDRGGELRIETVIVTATKREERLGDVPISIAVISAQDIERRGLIGMEDYLRGVPGVNQIDRGPADNSIVIRGITSQPQSDNLPGATVASYFGETPITGSAGAGAGGSIDVRPVDIERIEILRGPQGTTFGSSSLGGATRMIPVRPRLDAFGAKIAGSYSTTSGTGSDNSMMQGVVNVPVVEDEFALRAVGYRFEDSGFYRNVAADDPATMAQAQSWGIDNDVRANAKDDVGRVVSTGGRVAALWHAADGLDLSMNFLTQTIEQDGRLEATNGKYEQIRLPIAPLRRIRGERSEVSDTEMDLVNVGVDYDLGWGALTVAASSIDAGSDYNLGIVLGAFPSSSTWSSDFESSTLEARLASKFDGNFQFLGGVFYEDVDEEQSQFISSPGAPAPNPYVTEPIGSIERGRELDQRAVFGEVSYRLTEKLVATLGARYFRYNKNESIVREGGIFRIPIGGGVAEKSEKDENDSSFKADLSYKPTDASLLYASWAQGFRLGRATVGLPPATCDANSDGLVDGTGVTIESTRSVDSDFLDSYEVGGKFSLFDRRMVIDTSVYRIIWDGLPANVLAPQPCNLNYTANAGEANSDGIEFQASLFVVDGLRLDFGGGYTRAKLTKNVAAQGWRDGDRLPGSPKVSANLAAQYDFDIASYKTFVRADSFYTGEFYGNFQPSPLTEAGGYTKVDVRAGVEIGRVGVELFVRNLTNADEFTWRGLSNANSFFGYRLRPRTVGVQLAYSFE